MPRRYQRRDPPVDEETVPPPPPPPNPEPNLLGGLNLAGLSEERQGRLINATIASMQLKAEAEARKTDAEAAAIAARNEPPPVPTGSSQLEGEIALPPEALAAALLRPDLPRTEIGKIFLNTFNPKSLYKLSAHSRFKDNERDQNVVVDGDAVRVIKTSGTYKDFGNNPDVWSEGFLNYTHILCHFHAAKNIKLIGALIQFHNRIMQLARMARWSTCPCPHPPPNHLVNNPHGTGELELTSGRDLHILHGG
ncbi:MAG: hypothetical protein MMC33_009213 [Icmadophila ericetorum]|nr:hypothetical protein [Icmadophila ericetorum]